MGAGRAWTALALVAALSGCGALREGAEAPAEEAAPVAAGLGPGDVEAPEVFEVSAEGLWDGRPSLGGVWVAHPDVTDPQRAVVRNGDTGATVIGALFRRERESPGPAVQVSSEAAAALGMLAGDPAPLEVVALRREEPAEDPEAAAGEGAEGAAVDAAEPAPLDPVAVEPLPDVADAPEAAEAPEAAAPTDEPDAPAGAEP